MASDARSLAHETDDTETPASADQLLANLDEKQRNHVQMQQLRDATVEAGLLKVPVKRVTTAANSEQYVVEPDHPVLDASELRQYYEKPIRGWSDDYDIVKLLEWYCGGSDNPYDLQLHHVYLRYDGDAGGVRDDGEWRIVEPPTYVNPETWRERCGAALAALRTWVGKRRPRRTNAAMFALMVGGLVAGALASVAVPAGAIPVRPYTLATVAIFGGYLTATFLGLLALAPPDSGGESR